MTIGKSLPAGKCRTADPLPERPSSHPPDRLRLAGWLVRVAAGITMLAAAAAAGDALWPMGQHPERMAALYDAVGLSEIPLVPAGRQARRPVPMPAAVDWRFLPSLPDQDPGLVRLLDSARSGRQQAPPP